MPSFPLSSLGVEFAARARRIQVRALRVPVERWTEMTAVPS